MVPGPVFRFELLTMARRRRYFALRSLFGLVLLWIVWVSYPDTVSSPWGGQRLIAAHDAARAGRSLFLSVAVAQALAVLALTPAITAGVIADEKQRKTLHYLLASCLGSGEIVLGKLGARLLSAGVYLSVSVPVLGLLSLTGGVDPNDVLLLFAGSLSTTLLLASFAAVVSVHSRRPRDAMAAVYLFEFAWLFGPTLVRQVLPLVGRRFPEVQLAAFWVNDAIGATGPVYAIFNTGVLFSRSSARLYSNVFRMIATQSAVALIFMAVAVARLRPVYRREGARPLRSPDGGGLGRRSRWWRRPACGDDPVLWKELAVSRTSLTVRVASVLAGLGVLVLIGFATVRWATPAVEEIATRGYWASVEGYGHDQFNVYLRLVSAVLLAAGQLVAAASASSGLTSEREGDTWVSLIATPLTPFQIVRAKMVGALWATRAVAGLWLALVVTGVALGCVHPVGFMAAEAVAAVALWFAAALGVTFSLRARSSSRALAGTVCTLILLNGLYLVLLIPFRFDTTLPLAGVSAFAEAVSLLSYGNVARLPGVAGRLDWNAVDAMVTVVTSVGLYALMAALLTYSLVTDFDRVIDRPWTYDSALSAGRGGRG